MIWLVVWPTKPKYTNLLSFLSFFFLLLTSCFVAQITHDLDGAVFRTHTVCVPFPELLDIDFRFGGATAAKPTKFNFNFSLYPRPIKPKDRRSNARSDFVYRLSFDPPKIAHTPEKKNRSPKIFTTKTTLHVVAIGPLFFLLFVFNTRKSTHSELGESFIRERKKTPTCCTIQCSTLLPSDLNPRGQHPIDYGIKIILAIATDSIPARTIGIRRAGPKNRTVSVASPANAYTRPTRWGRQKTYAVALV